MLATTDISELGLTPVLEKYTESLRSVTDDRLRYQQLFFLAAKCPPMDESLKIEKNKVPGCLSTVHVHASMKEDGKIYYVGDSDAQMTKGLVAMLVNGLSGCTNEEIQRVQPEFIQYAGIANTLTPGRNNGFLNMMKVMKTQAKVLAQGMSSESSEEQSAAAEEALESNVPAGAGPMHRAMQMKLSMLKPAELVITNESVKHAGHAGMQGITSSESHFNVRIIANCFDGLSLVQRHKMVYTLLSQEMSGGIHALSIYAKTPAEEANK
jgi:sulfur transfer protein SufE/stress-induced morphogen